MKATTFRLEMSASFLENYNYGILARPAIGLLRPKKNSSKDVICLPPSSCISISMEDFQIRSPRYLNKSFFEVSIVTYAMPIGGVFTVAKAS